MLEFNGIGRVTHNIEIEQKQVKSGVMPYGKIRLAFDNGGNKPATFVSMDIWGKVAENAGKYLEKGSLVQVKGSMMNNNYKNKNGEMVYGDKLTIQSISYLDKKKQPADIAD